MLDIGENLVDVYISNTIMVTLQMQNYFINLDIVAGFMFADGYYLVLIACSKSREFIIKQFLVELIDYSLIISILDGCKRGLWMSGQCLGSVVLQF